MSVLDTAIRIKTENDLKRAFSPRELERPTLFLSASVPYRRKAGTDKQLLANPRYVATSQPERIRLAVRELTQSALMRNIRLVFGAHPDISPMVLEAARKLPVMPGSVLIFQSAVFEQLIPKSTLDLADWSKGLLFLTPEINAGAPDSRERSLAEMRALMLKTPGLCGAVFVGGMDGTEDEADLFESMHSHLPRYAIASTGSAALFLFDRASINRSPQSFAGKNMQQNAASLLDYPTSYKLTARRILDDMGFTPPPPQP
jgi:SLOG cluster3 family